METQILALVNGYHGIRLLSYRSIGLSMKPRRKYDEQDPLRLPFSMQRILDTKLEKNSPSTCSKRRKWLKT